ncbi:SGNH/GDSL hydrolase family protein [Sphingomonas sp. GV3]|uniref:SGNH/GDSL hydrolase family protein n=1 Tax=Sphingomonas sp. GV3 TaxID=3040671 RepID=UPI00280B1850|nr:SGNH/GDSL hydrolase family protein [Sphingomonas sp. GV3]
MIRLLPALLLALLPSAVQARTSQRVSPPPTAPTQRTILFIGNSFTQGAHSAVRNWHADRVVDLTGQRYGGVPALFKEFADEVGLRYAVSLETQGGRSLAFHYDERRQLFDRAWDVVVLQEYSTLDAERPGDPGKYLSAVERLTRLFRARNPGARIELTATWSRADQTYRPGGHWYGRGIAAMADDLAAAAERARRASGATGVISVGQAWTRAMAQHVADPDPYDGITFGQVNLWSYDQYHASIAGYYLEALMVFGRVTGLDPRMLGANERAADELGLSPDLALSLQRVAAEQLAADRGRG